LGLFGALSWELVWLPPPTFPPPAPALGVDVLGSSPWFTRGCAALKAEIKNQ